MSDFEKVSAFIKKISQQSKGTGKGQVRIDTKLVRELVADDADTAATVVWAYCQMAQENPSFFQLALLVATAYQIEFNDDSLVIEVEQAQGRSGAKPMPPIQILPDEDKTQGEAIRVLNVEPQDLMNSNVQHFVRLFSIRFADRKKLRQQELLSGRFVIAFPSVDSDPRPVTIIPEVRLFIHKLHEAMPYFPYYLDFRPELSMFFLYYGCLAHPTALSDNGTHINLVHISVTKRVLETLHAIVDISRQLDRDPKPMLQAILSAYPPDIARGILALLA